MPIFIDRQINGYLIRLRPHDNYRKFFRFIFHRDIFPYMYGVYLLFDLHIEPLKTTHIKECLKYQWQIKSLDEKTVFEPKQGEIQMLPSKKSKTKKPLMSELMIKPQQYLIDISITGENREPSKTEILAMLTIRDRDSVYETFSG